MYKKHTLKNYPMEPLFANVQLQNTINIIPDSIYQTHRKEQQKNAITFDSVICHQINAVVIIGSLLAPVLADIIKVYENNIAE